MRNATWKYRSCARSLRSIFLLALRVSSFIQNTHQMLFPGQLALAPGQAPHRRPGRTPACGWVMPWEFISLLGLAKTPKGSQIA